jgi:lysophospholipase L1-like esterase
MKKLLLLIVPALAGLTSLAPAQSAAPAPQAATAPAVTVDASAPSPKRGNARFYELHASFLKRGKEPMGVLFLGDSITEGWGKAPDVWKEHYEKYQPANFGIGGDRTQHVIWRIEDGELDGIKPKVVVLMIGTNNSSDNTGAQIAAADTKIVRLIREKIPGTKVLLLAVFPRGPRKDKAGIVIDDGVKRMAAIREVNAELAKLDDGKNVRFLDINAGFLGADGKIPDAIMPDQLHPNAAGYKIWAEAMQPLLDEMMK